jgi:hypothetical protein
LASRIRSPWVFLFDSHLPHSAACRRSQLFRWRPPFCERTLNAASDRGCARGGGGSSTLARYRPSMPARLRSSLRADRAYRGFAQPPRPPRPVPVPLQPSAQCGLLSRLSAIRGPLTLILRLAAARAPRRAHRSVANASGSRKRLMNSPSKLLTRNGVTPRKFRNGERRSLFGFDL